MLRNFSCKYEKHELLQIIFLNNPHQKLIKKKELFYEK